MSGLWGTAAKIVIGPVIVQGTRLNSLKQNQIRI